MWCLFWWHHMPKSHIASPFDQFDLTNGLVPLMTLLASCNTDTSMNGITEPKSYVAHCFKCLDQMKTVVVLTTWLTSYAGDASAICHMTGKSEVAPCLDHLEPKYVVVLLMMPTPASCDSKHHVAPCFNHLDIAIKVVPLTMPSISFDAHTGTNSITRAKESCHLVSVLFT